MTIFKERQLITVEKKTDEDLKTGQHIVTSVSFRSSNGLFYKVTNRPNSKSKTNLFLSFNGKILMNGDMNASAYRADSFLECKEHILFQLSKDDITAFFKKHENDRVGTLFVNTGYNKGASSVWINKKINYITQEHEIGMVMQSIAPKHRKLNVMEKFIYTNSTVEKTAMLTNIKGNVSMFKIMDDEKSTLFYSTYDSDTNTGVFKFVTEPERVVEGLNPSKYKVLLNDCLIKWAINNPRGDFANIVNDYGFTDDMTYSQVKKMNKMIKI